MSAEGVLSETVVEAFVEQTVAALNLTESIRHPGEGGRAREQVIRRFLAQLLPAGVRIDSGFVIDSTGAVSRQADLIVYRDNYHPVFEIGGIKHIMAEAALAVIENKARIQSRGDLSTALENIASVKRLDRSGQGRNRELFPALASPVDPSNFRHQVLGVIIAQRSMSRDTLLGEWHSFIESHSRHEWPNLYVDVKEFDIAYYLGRMVTSTDPTKASATATRINGVPLADLAYELANWIRIAPLIDYPPSAYFGLAGGLGGGVINRPIASPARSSGQLDGSDAS